MLSCHVMSCYVTLSVITKTVQTIESKTTVIWLAYQHKLFIWISNKSCYLCQTKFSPELSHVDSYEAVIWRSDLKIYLGFAFYASERKRHFAKKEMSNYPSLIDKDSTHYRFILPRREKGKKGKVCKSRAGREWLTIFYAGKQMES